MEAELPGEKVEAAIQFYKMLGDTAKVGFRIALTRCDCHICNEILRRIQYGNMR
jgi:hypothetical protein